MANSNPDLSGNNSGRLSPSNAPSPVPQQEGPPEDVFPAWDFPVAMPVTESFSDSNIPVALPVDPEVPFAALAEPLSLPVAQPLPPGAPGLEPVAPLVPVAVPVELPQPPPQSPSQSSSRLPSPLPVAQATAPSTITCPVCSTVARSGQFYCDDCGYHFSSADLAALSATTPPSSDSAAPPQALTLLRNRYELAEMTSDRLGVQRFRGLDRGDDGPPSVEVVIVRQKLPEPVLAEAAPIESEEDILPSFDDSIPTAFPATEILQGMPLWPSIAWERRLLLTLEHPGLPVERDYFADEHYEYLVLERPQGQLLWDAWDDPEADASRRFGLLSELAQTLKLLHQCNAMVEALRPDIVVVDSTGVVRLADLGDLLPIPLPEGSPIRGTLYTAPEVMNGNGSADARADLYSFGAMLYALHVGRELNERTDFDGPGSPKPFIPRFPDIHPAFGRLMMKTFRKEVEARFPSDEASREDATGFTELIRTLEVLRRTFDHVRLDVASWTSTGIIRTGNEDAFAVLHAAESRQDDLGEAALVLLCDGMGGYEAGEVAASLTLQSLRQQLSQLRPFSVAAGASPFLTDPLTQMSRPEGHMPPPVDVEAVKQALRSALREANRHVFQTSRAPGSRRRGMGCTAEAVYVDGRHVVVGHVGDSRTYHLHEGRLIQLTRDQTLVNRLVELGTLSEEEAETHPRRNELQQAIGGQPDVDPGLYVGKLTPGDWIIVCSDGLTNHVHTKDLLQMLQSEASSAEMCARRLVNLTLIEGATDNVTVVAIRVV